MDKPNNCLPSYERLSFKYKFQKGNGQVILLLLLLLLGYCLISFTNSYTFTCFLAFLCETWFTISWLLTISTKWTPAVTKTYPERLLQRVSESELPPVDLFVTTADPELEPPIITVNTVLSLLALDYPAHKLACYVSDDGCSPLTFYLLWKPQNLLSFGYLSVRSITCKPELHVDASLIKILSTVKTHHQNLSKNGYR
ncbi:hypothetical protein L6164_022203 [Bauhinia variegata]|uniref:Uncharacterized protein n=1 Tax=Bauhinia variegata TaxID=167791 RepID=A0ACB9MFX6_BAUVA|nr:hypothetical protein L6164_022203 [Bauhinia variegata]